MSYSSNTDLITVPQKASAAPSSAQTVPVPRLSGLSFLFTGSVIFPGTRLLARSSPSSSFTSAPGGNCGLLLLCLLDCQLPEGRGVTYLQAWGRPLVNTCELVSPVDVPAHHRHLHFDKVQEEGERGWPTLTARSRLAA